MENTNTSTRPVPMLIAGLGGFGQAHHTSAQILEAEGLLKLLATCDPRHAELVEQADRFALDDREVTIYADFQTMLDEQAAQSRITSIATPIKLHAPMHEACVRHKQACYLEKPPTLDPAELERMIATDREAEFQTQVGFNYVVEPWRHELKSRLLSGEFGALNRISFLGYWQRTLNYYRRTTGWAGKLMWNGELLLDSCFGNAMSHHVHNVLFFAGKDAVLSWAEIEKVDCELYRANPIQGTDTVCTRAITREGVELRIGMSHATSSSNLSLESIHCEKADILITPNHFVEIHHSSGKKEKFDIHVAEGLIMENFRHFAKYVLGEKERPLTLLADCRPFVHWNALNYLAAGHIQTIPDANKQETTVASTGATAWVISDVETPLADFVNTGRFPSEAGLPWAAPGGSARKTELPNLHDVIAQLAEESDQRG